MFDLAKLGVQKNVPKVDFKAYSGILVCPPKFGKTTIASMFPDSVICAFEMGVRGQAVNFVPTFTWEAFVDFLDKLEDNRADIGDSISTIVIDTINKAEEIIEPYILRKQGRVDGKKYTKPNEIPFGGFYTAKDKEMRTQIDRIDRMGFTILYLTHSRVKTITPKTGDPYDVMVSAMSDRCEKFVYPSVDYILHGTHRMVDDGMGNMVLKRVLISSNNEDATAGNRVHFDEDIVFDTEEEAMSKFQTLFAKTIADRLKRAGITESVESIAKKQAVEKAEEVKKYVADRKALSNDDMVSIIKAEWSNMADGVKADVAKTMKEYGIESFSNPDDLSTEGLTEIVRLIKG